MSLLTNAAHSPGSKPNVLLSVQFSAKKVKFYSMLMQASETKSDEEFFQTAKNKSHRQSFSWWLEAYVIPTSVCLFSLPFCCELLKVLMLVSQGRNYRSSLKAFSRGGGGGMGRIRRKPKLVWGRGVLPLLHCLPFTRLPAWHVWLHLKHWSKFLLVTSLSLSARGR